MYMYKYQGFVWKGINLIWLCRFFLQGGIKSIKTKQNQGKDSILLIVNQRLLYRNRQSKKTALKTISNESGNGF